MTRDEAIAEAKHRASTNAAGKAWAVYTPNTNRWHVVDIVALKTNPQTIRLERLPDGSIAQFDDPQP